MTIVILPIGADEASFRHKGLQRFFENDDPSKLSPVLVERIRTVLSAIDAARSLADLSQPSFRLHPLKGDRKGSWAVTVRANWRIIFRFVDGDATEVDLSTITKERPMPMMPAHPGALLADDLQELGVSIAEAAKGIGVTRQQLYNVINGKSAITAEMAIRLEKAVGGTADHWLRTQLAHDLARTRLREGEIDARPLSRKVA